MNASTYKAAVLTSPGHIEIRDLPVPVLASGEALVRVRYVGICGTDLALYKGTYQTSLPMVPGHEFAGEVTAVGDPSASAWIGREVTAEINNTCIARREHDLCAACAGGMPNHCSTRTVLGIVGCDGAMAEFVKVPILNLHALPESAPLRYGVFAEPLAAAIRTFEVTPISAGDIVVVLGCGRLGVLVCKVAALKGARVIAVSRSPYKLQLAKIFGSHIMLDAGQQDIVKEVHALTNGLGAHVVVECTGTPDGLDSALRLVRPTGIICMKSTPGEPVSGFPFTQAVVDEVTLQGSRCGNLGKAIRMIERHNLRLDTLISEVYPSSEIRTAFEAAGTKFKVLIEL